MTIYEIAISHHPITIHKDTNIIIQIPPTYRTGECESPLWDLGYVLDMNKPTTFFWKLKKPTY